jgi:hypothetical protein
MQCKLQFNFREETDRVLTSNITDTVTFPQDEMVRHYICIEPHTSCEVREREGLEQTKGE